jgi:Stage II sporulation protein M
MTESQFIEENKQKWKDLEEALENKSSDPDQLHALFKKVSGDLSYAQTYFPRRSVRWYLNALVNAVFDTMRTKKKLNFWSALLNFYSNTLPVEIIRNRNAFIASIVVFALSVCIGIFSTIQDSDFPTSILGSEYMSITEENIQKGDPMGIYKTDTDIYSFLRITVNNIRVAFLTFALGFLASIGSIFLLIKNGVMLGVFDHMDTWYYRNIFNYHCWCCWYCHWQ